MIARRSCRLAVAASAALVAGMLTVPATVGAEPATDTEVLEFAQATTDETLVTMSPQRFADSRLAGTTIDGAFAGGGRLAADSVYEVQIGGRGGVPADALGTIVNVTAINPAATGFVTTFDCSADVPLASSLNYTEGVNLGNEVIAGLSATGALCVYTAQEVDVTLDVVGYVPVTSSLMPITPARLLETREGEPTVDGTLAGIGQRSAGQTTRIPVAGRGDVPDTVDAALVNVTAIHPEGDSFLRVHACIDPLPFWSSLNYVDGVTRGNELLVDIDPMGDICVTTEAPVDLAVDVLGYLMPGTNLKNATPARLADTRASAETVDDLFAGDGRLLPGADYEIRVAGRAGIPVDAASAVLSVAAVKPDAVGYFTVHPCDDPPPLAASLNYVGGVTGGTELIVDLDDEGDVCVFTSGAADVTVDATGYLATVPEPVDTADLSVTKSDDVDPVLAGSPVTYTIEVANAGPADATGVTVMDVLPTGVTFVSTVGCAEDPNGVPTCTIGDLAAGASALVDVAVTVDIATSGEIVNQVGVMSDLTDPDASNNSASESTTVTGLGTINIVKATDPPGGTGYGFTDDIEAPNAFTLDDGQTQTFTDVVPGTYTVTEDDVAPQNLTDLTCDDGASATPSTGDVASRTATINLDSGETVTCTFGNNRNTAPEITSDGGGDTAALNVDENQTAVTDVDATDDFSSEGSGLEYFIAGPDASAFFIDPATGVLTFGFTPDFENPTDAGGDGTYDVEVTVEDDGPGAVLADVQNIAVTVDNVNEAPVITSDGGGATASVNAPENQTFVTDLQTSDDSDSEGSGLLYSLTTVSGGGVDNGDFNLDANTGLLTFISAPDFENPTDTGGDGVYDVQVTVTDSGPGTALTDVQDIAVTVTDVNENPVIVSDGGGATASVNAAENQTFVTDVQSVDDANSEGAGLTYTITGGADQALFSIGALSGVLTFASAPDFDNPTDTGGDGVYDVQVTVTDSGIPNLTDAQDIAVTVTDVNENPIITSNGGGATASINAPENQTAVTTVTATDPDMPAQTLTFTITGGADQALFGITAGGVLTFNSARDFENPTDSGGDGVYDVEVTVTDNGIPNLTDVQDIAVTVTDVNDPPVAVDDSYTGQPVNVRLDAGANTVTGIEVNDALGVLEKGTDDSDPENDSLSVTEVIGTTTETITAGGSATITTTEGGTVTMDSDGTFTYISAVGEDATTDSFDYTLSDGGLTDTGTVTITLGDTIWFVDQPTVTGGPNDGRSTSPFESLADFNAANLGGAGQPGDGDTVFLLTGQPAGYTDGATLRDDQLLVGEEQGLTSGALTILAGTAPVIAPATGDGISLADGNTIRGLNIGNTPGGHGVSGTVVGTLTVSNVEISGTGGLFEVSASGNLDAVTFDSLVSTASSPPGAGAIDLVGITGTTGFAGGAPTITNSGGSGIEIASSTAPITFTGGTITNAAGNAIDIDGGTADVTIATAVTNAANRSVEITNRMGGTVTVSGNINDTGTGILVDFNSGGSVIDFRDGLIDLNTGSSDAATISNNGGAFINFVDGGLIINTTSGDGFSVPCCGTVTVNSAITASVETITGVPLSMNATIGAAGMLWDSVTASGAPIGIRLNNAGSGSFTATSGTIASTTVDSLEINGGTGNVTIGASLSNAAGHTVDIDGKTGGTVALSGAINENADGIDLTSNTGTTITFTGELDIDTTGTSTGFNATGGGTVSATIPGGGNNSVDTSAGTGTAVNVANTAIGVADLNFTSVDVDGAANGIVLNATGTSGGLTITGDGSNARNASGGTIRNTTGDAIVLTNTQDFSATSLDIANHGTSLGDQHGIDATNLRGTNVVRASRFSGVNDASGDYIRVVNTSTNMALLEVNDTLFTGVPNNGNDAIFLDSKGTSNTRLDVTNNTHFQGIRGDAVQVLADDDSIVAANISDSRFSNDGGIQPGGPGGGSASRLSLRAADGSLPQNSGGTLTADVSGNVFDDTGVQAGALPVGLVGVIDIQGDQFGSVTSTVSNNTIQNIDEDGGVRIIHDDSSSGTHLIDDNDFLTLDEVGVFFHTRDTAGATDLTIRNNDIGTNAAPVGTDVANFNEDSIRLHIDEMSARSRVHVVGNTIFNNSSSQGLDVDAEDSADLQLTVHGNTITNLGLDGEAFDIESDNGGGICLDLNGDNVGANANTFLQGGGFPQAEGVIDLETDGGTFQIEDLAGGTTAAAVDAFLTARNTFNNDLFVEDTHPSLDFSSVAECSMPSLP